MDTQIHEAKGIPNRLNLKSSTLGHIIIKLLKKKNQRQRILKAATEEQPVTSKGTLPTQHTQKIISSFSMVISQARRQWEDVFKL